MSRKPESKRPARADKGLDSTTVAAPPLSAGLYLVATPIGNAADITLRAIDLLSRADVLVCEDTRQTRKLLEIHAIPLNGRKLVSYHDQSSAGRRAQILNWLEQDMSVALCSDAGTPMIADPGYRLVIEAQAAGYAIHALPGASAVLTALCLSGLPTDRFLFAGFLPPRSSARRTVLQEFAGLVATLVFYESPRRLAATLGDMTSVLGGERVAVVARELTKKFEETRRGSLQDLTTAYADEATPRGEIVIVVGPPDKAAQAERAVASLDELLIKALVDHSVKEAARLVADLLSLPKRDVYARALALSGK